MASGQKYAKIRSGHTWLDAYVKTQNFRGKIITLIKKQKCSQFACWQITV